MSLMFRVLFAGCKEGIWGRAERVTQEFVMGVGGVLQILVFYML